MAPADPVVLITGATGDLGRVIAATFAADGARLGLVGTDGGRLAAVAADLRLADDRWAPGVGDLGDPAGARAAVDAVVDRFERIDSWLHVVGGWAGGTAVADLDPAEMRSMLDQHLWTTLHVAQAVVPGMVARGWGRIVAVTTPFALTPGAKGASYAVGKGAKDLLIRALAREVAGTGVTANLVVVRKIGEGGTSPESIAAAMRYLCSDDAAAINGGRIPLDAA